MKKIAVPEQISIIVDLLTGNGGRPMLIGGAVIDAIAGRAIKDWDIEVYGLSYAQLLELLSDAGYGCDLVGKKFGIVKTRAGDVDVDLNVPRKENRCGVGHKGFSVELLPDMSPEEAGRRRDLTINSMYLDLVTQELVDPFGGTADFQAGIIRATNPETFIEDPLRVLRIMQLLPRKGKVVDPQTMKLCQGMVSEFPTLAKERVFEEWAKLLLKADRPSVGLEFLRETGWLAWFPELYFLIGCPQRPEWHPEGDVWNHTLLVLDNAAQLRDQLPDDWRLAFMFGALLHDVGKPYTTTQELTSPGHDTAGVPVADGFMRRITDNKELIRRTLLIVEKHMQPGQLHRDGAKPAAWRRLHNKIRLDVIGLMSRADSNGRSGLDLLGEHGPSGMALAFFEEFGAEPICPVLGGKHLIAAGYKAGPAFKVMLDRAYQYQIEHNCEDLDVLIGVATEVK
ncbi:HD domain-containing protein [Acinetobacter sp.]|uniref:CCA tRNA nucleotidyltransferase n=1 Tax=Acinetobacter sp. TaxID=472 RepID=UPI003D00548B